MAEKLTLLTINYNDRKGLERTLRSIEAQQCRNFQYVVIDGGSTDGSVDLIKQYAHIIDYGVSEPDGGIYNAMNKGIAAATGQYTLVVNAGDALHSPAVTAQFEACISDADIIVGTQQNVRYDEQGRMHRCGRQRPYKRVRTETFLSSTVLHGAAFIRTSLLRQNPYDESLRIVSDWKFLFEELILRGATYATVPFTVNLFETTGISSSPQHFARRMAEQDKVIESIMPLQVARDYSTLYTGRPKVARWLRTLLCDGPHIRLYHRLKHTK